MLSESAAATAGDPESGPVVTAADDPAPTVAALVVVKVVVGFATGVYDGKETLDADFPKSKTALEVGVTAAPLLAVFAEKGVVPFARLRGVIVEPVGPIPFGRATVVVVAPPAGEAVVPATVGSIQDASPSLTLAVSSSASPRGSHSSPPPLDPSLPLNASPTIGKKGILGEYNLFPRIRSPPCSSSSTTFSLSTEPLSILSAISSRLIGLDATSQPNGDSTVVPTAKNLDPGVAALRGPRVSLFSFSRLAGPVGMASRLWTRLGAEGGRGRVVVVLEARS